MQKFLFSLSMLFGAAFLHPVYSQIKALKFGKVLDGKGTVINDAIIIVNGNRIEKVGSKKEIIIPAGAEVIDLEKYTAIPGLIDAHTHLTYYWDKSPGTTPWSQIGTLGSAVTVFLAQASAIKTLETGVTTIRDLGSLDYMDVAMRNLIERGAMVGPRMLISGFGLHVSNDAYKLGLVPDAGQCDGITEVQRVARQQIAAGANWIKMYASTGSDRNVTANQTFTYEEMKAAADVAHFAGKRLAIHLYGKNGVSDAIKAGTNTIEHAIEIDDSDLAEMAKKGIVYVPTVEHNNYYIQHRLEYGYDSTVVKSLQEYMSKNFETLKRAIRAKVTIAMGSDAVFTGFGENTNELLWFVKAGMSNEEALQTATTNAAKMLDMEKELGQLTPGYYADIVAVEGDPLKDINVVIKKVRWVMKDGKVVVKKTE